MKGNTLLKISIICAIIGVSALYFISEQMEVKQVSINNLTDEEIGKEVKIIGRVERASNTDKVIFLEVGEQKIVTVSVVLFKDKDVALKEGDYVELIGTIEEYKGEYSIIANAVKVR